MREQLTMAKRELEGISEEGHWPEECALDFWLEVAVPAIAIGPWEEQHSGYYTSIDQLEESGLN